MAQFPEPKKLDILEIGDGRDNLDKLIGTYTLDKPHPGYGKDDNIINQLGHTVYPKWVYPSGNSAPGVIVNSVEEEAEAMSGKVEKQPAAKDNSAGWS
jgi:hypothetical protein